MRAFLPRQAASALVNQRKEEMKRKGWIPMAFRKRLQAVHVPHHKNTAGMKAEPIAPPKEVLLPMNMHMGTPAVPVVSVGDYVRVGQKIANG